MFLALSAAALCLYSAHCGLTFAGVSHLITQLGSIFEVYAIHYFDE